MSSEITLEDLMSQHDYGSSPWRFPVFSYGINANIESLKMRCPSWDGLWTLAKLSGYRMEFSKQYKGINQRTYCNIHKDSSSEVWGALVWLDIESFIRIDAYEGFPEHYQRTRVAVHCPELKGHTGSTFRPAQALTSAWVYISDNTGPAAPPLDYYLGVLNGLDAIGVPYEYLQNVIQRCAHRWIGRESLQKRKLPNRLAGQKQSKKQKQKQKSDKPDLRRLTLPREMWAETAEPVDVEVVEMDGFEDGFLDREDLELLRRQVTV